MLFKAGDINYMTDQDCKKVDKQKIHSDIIDYNLSYNNVSCLEIQLDFRQKIMAEKIARCKCCLESGRLKSMWQEHCSRGLREVYGTMLTECFGLHWSRPQNPKKSLDLICESCILRLRDAVSFKTEVLASEQLLSIQLEGVDVGKLKQERDDIDVNIQTEYLHYEDLEVNTDNDEDINDNNFPDEEIDRLKEAIKMEPVSSNDKRTTFGNEESSGRRSIRRLSKRKLSTEVSRRMANSESSRTNSAPKRFKKSRKLKNEDDLSLPVRKRSTKLGTVQLEDLNENLRGSIEASQSKNMSSMAAIAYDVPCEVIVKEVSKVQKICGYNEDSKETKRNNQNGNVFVEIPGVDDLMRDFRNNAHGKEFENDKFECKEKEKDTENNVKKFSENRLAEMKKQANNIAIILEFTNATPIRRHGGIGYGCCFCNEEFPDAADLKQHTIKEHDVKTKRNYAKGKRPSAYLVKLDITGLKCDLCDASIDSLEQLYDHLIEVHKKLLYRNAKKYIIPFKFEQEELRCLFCEFICNSFKGLLEHMSVHYRNHICEVCDAGFLTKNNLFNHAGRHKKGTFKCDYCSKVFDTSSKKAGHQRLVHSSTKGVNRCGYCGEMFGTYRRKEKHLMTEHGVTLKKLKCKACDKTFETQTALRIHTKRDHLIERRFKCSVCDKRCFTNVQLNQHTLKHTGIKKFQCTICLKAYGRKSTLREHMRIHENDRRFKCELCGMAFVQKCSWRGHMLSKHGQQV